MTNGASSLTMSPLPRVLAVNIPPCRSSFQGSAPWKREGLGVTEHEFESQIHHFLATWPSVLILSSWASVSSQMGCGDAKKTKPTQLLAWCLAHSSCSVGPFSTSFFHWRVTNKTKWAEWGPATRGAGAEPKGIREHQGHPCSCCRFISC